MLLSIGFVVVALLLVTAVVSATGIHLERKRLTATADALAAEAADELAQSPYYDEAGSCPGLDSDCGGGISGPGATGDGIVRLTDEDVRRAVDAYLDDNPDVRERFVRFEVIRASSPDGRSALVRLGAVARPALISWATGSWSDGIALEVEVSARAW